MADNIRSLIQAPEQAKRGEIITLRATIGHPMETGYRRGSDGQMLQRDLVRRFVCQFNGKTVFVARLHAAVAANPYVAFPMRAEASGSFTFIWEGDNGLSHRRTQSLVVA